MNIIREQIIIQIVVVILMNLTFLGLKFSLCQNQKAQGRKHSLG